MIVIILLAVRAPTGDVYNPARAIPSFPRSNFHNHSKNAIQIRFMPCYGRVIGNISTITMLALT